ncbi:MAG: hypothetical protein Kow0042_17340 [Calditrichia bacterium]
MMKKLFLLFLTFAVLILWCIGCSQSGSGDDTKEEKIPVEVSLVKKGDVVQTINYIGDVEAEYEVSVFSKIMDRIEKFYVDEGDYVKKGDPIAKIAATTIEQAVRQAEAALVSAKAQESNLRVEYERALRLKEANALSQQQLDAIQTQFESVQAQVEQAEAALVSARDRLNDALVRAPISGIIGKRYFDEGDMANMTVPLVTIVQMDRVKVEFNATEEDLGKLATGQAATIRVKAYPDKVFHGKVTKISPILDPTTRMAEIEVLVENPEKLLKPGMYAQVEVTTGVIEDVIVVPRYAAIENTTLEKIEGEDRVVKNFYVFVVDSNQAVQRKLNVRYANHRWLAVNSGVQIGELLVVAGQNNLRDGMPVTIVNQEDM